MVAPSIIPSWQWCPAGVGLRRSQGGRRVDAQLPTRESKFADKSHTGAGAGAAWNSSLESRKGQGAFVGNLQLVELLRHQAGGAVFPEPGFRMGKNLLGDADDFLLPLFDGPHRRAASALEQST